MGEHSESTKSLYPKTISGRHRAVMRMLIAGHTKQDICNELGFDNGRLSIIIHSPLFKEEMGRMERDVGKEFVEAEGKKLQMDTTAKTLSGATEKAARTLEGALSDESGQVRISAAKDILDRGGYQKEEKVRANVFVEPSQSLIDMLERVSGGATSPPTLTGDMVLDKEKRDAGDKPSNGGEGEGQADK